jgi:Domain of unknown function (DUF4928)
MDAALDDFIERQMRKAGRLVPARLQRALALLERLRDTPALRLDAHKRSNSSGLDSHETFGANAHGRLALDVINKTHGRRSSDVGGWGQELLDLLAQSGFANATRTAKAAMIDAAQRRIARAVRSILEQEPLEVRLKGRSAEAVIQDVLTQAEAKGKAGDVAQYLVGAKLMLRLDREIPVRGSNVGDRKSRRDSSARTGDFEIENATIEVAMGLPDEKHLLQAVEVLENAGLELWLLTRRDRVAVWRQEFDQVESLDVRRVVVAAVESFVGQNVTEMGAFSEEGRIAQLRRLFTLYNERWIAGVAMPGLRIVVK